MWDLARQEEVVVVVVVEVAVECVLKTERIRQKVVKDEQRATMRGTRISESVQVLVKV